MFGSCPDWINYFEKKFIYLFIYLFLKLLFACLGLGGGPVLGWCLLTWCWNSNFLVLFCTNALVYFKIECVGKNTPQLIIIIPIFSRATSLALFIASPDSCPGP